MLAGQSRLQSITLTNQGYAPWLGVRLTPPTLSWVRIDGLLEIGDIPPGGNANFTLRIEPPLSLPTTAYAQNPLLEVQSLNASTMPINAAITVTSSKQGTLVFNVINADKPRGTDGLGVPVPGAVATLKSLDIAGLSFKVTADANGIIQFANAPSGNYAWTLEAEGFQPDAGSIVLEPGLTKTLEKILATATIKYSWSVTPTTIVDKYDMALSVEFKTDVPAPIVVIDPTVITIDVPSHVDAFGQFTVTNLGLVSQKTWSFNRAVGWRGRHHVAVYDYSRIKTQAVGNRALQDQSRSDRRTRPSSLPQSWDRRGLGLQVRL